MKRVLVVLVFFIITSGFFTVASENANQNTHENKGLGDFNPVSKTTQSGNSNGLMNSSWPMCCHDIRHTGLSFYNTKNSPAVVKWRYRCDWVNGGIAIDNESVIYFGDYSRNLNALYPNGTLKWRYHAGDWIDTVPAIGSDGTIYVGSWDGYLYAFFNNGSLKWKHGWGDAITYSSPVIASDGTIYVGTFDPTQSLIAMNPNGTEKWRYRTGAYISSAPAIGDDGTIYFGSADTYVYGLYPNGTLRWRFKTGDRVMGSPSIAEDGTVYIGSWDGYLYALNPMNGSIIWRCSIGGGTKVNPSIGPDGTIYVGYDRLYAVYPNGTERWAFNLGNLRTIVWSSPAVSADGIIYVGTNIGEDAGGEILAVNPNGTERWREKIATARVDSSPAIGEDGTIYIGCVMQTAAPTGYLYAFGRGELLVNANGPYNGYYNEDMQFASTIYGGIPPYTYHWDFGDSNTSDQQNPTHHYTSVGVYNITLSVTDTEHNNSNDTTTATIRYRPPTVTITKPLRALYIMNIPLRPFLSPDRIPLIIGPLTIRARVTQPQLGIDHVDFYIDGILQATVNQAPFTWKWTNQTSLKHTITVIAYDTQNNTGSTSLTVWKFF